MYFSCICGEGGDLHVLLLRYLDGLLHIFLIISALGALHVKSGAGKYIYIIFLNASAMLSWVEILLPVQDLFLFKWCKRIFLMYLILDILGDFHSFFVA